jgi:hypothetical protein
LARLYAPTCRHTQLQFIRVSAPASGRAPASKGTTAAHRPPTAKWRIRVGVNPNLTYHIIARPGLETMLHPLPRGDPGILTMLTDNKTRDARDLYALPNRVIPSYLAAEVARCQHHHMFISMRARRILGFNPRVFYIGHYPIRTIPARMENSGARF